jgi:hemerythrin-like domain-containing protein
MEIFVYMKASDVLRNEHKLIDRMVLVVDNWIEQDLTEKKLPDDFFDKAVEFFMNYVIHFHFDKEEELLFSEMEKAGIDIEELPIEVFRHEHRVQQEALQQIGAKLAETDVNVMVEREDLINSFRIFTNLLKKHSIREDRVLYPMCDRLIGERSDRKLLDYFVRLGDGFREYQDKYETMTAKYEKILEEK